MRLFLVSKTENEGERMKISDDGENLAELQTALNTLGGEIDFRECFRKCQQRLGSLPKFGRGLLLTSKVRRFFLKSSVLVSVDSFSYILYVQTKRARASVYM